MISSYLEQIDVLRKKDEVAFLSFSDCLKKGSTGKGDMLLNIGSTCRNMHILHTGAVRHFRLDQDGREFNAWFSFEGELVTAMESFVMQTPSPEGIEAIEDCEYLYISYNDLNRLTSEFHAVESLYRQLLEAYYIEVERRLYRMQVYTAKQKYNYLIENKPHFLNRIAQIHIASFLGVAQETLSRIRKQK